MNGPRRWMGVVVWGVAVVGMLIGVALTFDVTTQITHFLPEPDDPELGALSRALTRAPVSRTMILTLEGPDLATALDRADTLRAELAEQPEVAWVSTGPSPEMEGAFYKLFFPRRYLLATDDPEGLDGRLDDAGLRAAAARLKRELGGPAGPLVRTFATRDPLLTWLDAIERFRAGQQGGLAVKNGRFVSRDGCCAVVFATTRSSAFESSAQKPIQDLVGRLVKQLRSDGTRLEQSSVQMFAVEAQRSIQADITRISAMSIVAVALLFLGVFVTPRPWLLAHLPIATGLLTGLFVNLVVFDTLHGLTLAFGATLIGVTIDYPVHLFNHHWLVGQRGSARAVGGAILIGSLTTVLGFAALAGTGFPGLVEVAVFAISGVVAAVATTLLVLPVMLPDAPRVGRLHTAIARMAAGLVRRRRRWPHTVVPVMCALLCAVGLPQVDWVDDPSVLTRLDPELQAQDARVRARVARVDAGRLVVVSGPTDSVLDGNDRVARVLGDAVKSGELEGFSSLHRVVFGPDLQRRNGEKFFAAGDLSRRTLAALEADAFKPALFAGFLEPAEPLLLSELQDGPLAPLLSPFLVPLPGDGEGERTAALTFLRGVKDSAAVEARVEEEGGLLFDQRTFMADLYGRFRSRATHMVPLGLVAILLVLTVRLRKPRRVLAAFAPAVLAAATTAALLGMFGVQMNILHLISLLLVLSIGVDYGVFLAESTGETDSVVAALVSMAMACVTTVLGFGLLGMSQAPALQAIGLTVGIGVTVSVLVAPSAWLLVHQADPENAP